MFAKSAMPNFRCMQYVMYGLFGNKFLDGNVQTGYVAHTLLQHFEHKKFPSKKPRERFYRNLMLFCKATVNESGFLLDKDKIWARLFEWFKFLTVKTSIMQNQFAMADLLKLEQNTQSVISYLKQENLLDKLKERMADLNFRRCDIERSRVYVQHTFPNLENLDVNIESYIDFVSFSLNEYFCDVRFEKWEELLQITDSVRHWITRPDLFFKDYFDLVGVIIEKYETNKKSGFTYDTSEIAFDTLKPEGWNGNDEHFFDVRFTEPKTCFIKLDYLPFQQNQLLFHCRQLHKMRLGEMDTVNFGNLFKFVKGYRSNRCNIRHCKNIQKVVVGGDRDLLELSKLYPNNNLPGVCFTRHYDEKKRVIQFVEITYKYVTTYKELPKNTMNIRLVSKTVGYILPNGTLLPMDNLYNLHKRDVDCPEIRPLLLWLNDGECKKRIRKLSELSKITESKRSNVRPKKKRKVV